MSTNTRLSVTSDSVYAVFSNARHLCGDWPRFPGYCWRVAGNIVRAGCTHSTGCTTPLTSSKTRSIGESWHRCWYCWRDLGSDKSISQVFTSGVGDHWRIREHTLVSRILCDNTPMFLQDFGYLWKPGVVWNRENYSVSHWSDNLKKGLTAGNEFDFSERCSCIQFGQVGSAWFLPHPSKLTHPCPSYLWLLKL